MACPQLTHSCMNYILKAGEPLPRNIDSENRHLNLQISTEPITQVSEPKPLGSPATNIHTFPPATLQRLLRGTAGKKLEVQTELAPSPPFHMYPRHTYAFPPHISFFSRKSAPRITPLSVTVADLGRQRETCSTDTRAATLQASFQPVVSPNYFVSRVSFPNLREKDTVHNRPRDPDPRQIEVQVGSALRGGGRS